MITDPDCLFCKIVAGEIPSTRVFEDDKVLSFMDINPVGEGHLLVIPRNHYPTIFDIPEGTEHLSVWFLNTSVSGGSLCEAYDSNFGENYGFVVKAN